MPKKETINNADIITAGEEFFLNVFEFSKNTIQSIRSIEPVQLAQGLIVLLLAAILASFFAINYRANQGLVSFFHIFIC